VAEDEQLRARIMQIMQPRQAAELIEEESWQLLGSVSLGRVVFTMNAMPAAGALGSRADGSRHRDHAADHHRHPPRRLVPLTALPPSMW
jgi:hypothetical protein